jgi:hypothetical protein
VRDRVPVCELRSNKKRSARRSSRALRQNDC